MYKRANILVGQSLVELLVTIAIAAIVLPALLLGVYEARIGRTQTNQRQNAYSQAASMLEEVRNIRDSGWNSIATDGTYYIVQNGSTWKLVSGWMISNGFTSSITIADVYRDASGTIVSSGGSIDSSTKAITVTVSWLLPYPNAASITEYLTNYASL